MNKPSEEENQTSLLLRAYMAIDELETRLDEMERTATEPIAIVGMGCRFPGGANSPEAFWEMLREGRDASTEVPADRWDVDAYYDADPDAPGKAYTRRGNFVDQVDRFDAPFFGISPREAVSLDPQQRLLLEVAWEALEHAGLAPDTLVGSQTGVFVGIMNNDYARLLMVSSDIASIDAYTATGNGFSFPAGRLSYILGLQGPSMAIDTACSSSLVAVHLACQSLRAGECNLALAGGTNLILAPDMNVILSRLRAISPDGRCKAFDARADGYGRGEGCGVLVLKRLSDARADGDLILALVRGCAVNHDGSSAGLTVPNGPAQQAVIRKALQRAGVEPAQVNYVEAHGTGTALGDPIEVHALAAVLGSERSPQHPVLLGSAKSNIGHLEAAAGMAGIIKVILSMQHEAIPPHLHLQTPSSHIAWKSLPVAVVTSLTPWPHNETARIAGVSSFGMSGINAHVVLEEAPILAAPDATAARTPRLLALSAKNDAALHDLAGRYAAHLATHPDLTLADLCATANTGRSHFPARLATVATTVDEVQTRLASLATGQPSSRHGNRPPRITRDITKVAFLFPGQSAQYAGMGRQLYEREPVFRQMIQHCDTLLRPYLDRPLTEVLFPSAADSPALLEETAYAQPALFVLEYALAQVWRAWGVEPDRVLGHSLGEYTAACLAGVFSLEDGLKLVAARGRLMQTLVGEGAMTTVWVSEKRISELLRRWQGAVTIAAVNGPEVVVIAGAKEAVVAVEEALIAQGLRWRRLTGRWGFHSPWVEPMLARWRQIVQEVRLSPPHLGLIAGLSGQMAGEDVAQGEYWVRQVRESVRYATGIETLQQAGVGVYVEMGPGVQLAALGRRIVEDEGVWTVTLREGHDEERQMLESLGRAYEAGVHLDWAALERGQGGKRVVLPTYPFQRERFWAAIPSQSHPLPREHEAVPSSGNASVQAEVPANTVTLNESSFVQLLQKTHPDKRRNLLGEHVRTVIADVLGAPLSQVAETQQGFFDMGMDSLMSVELRKRLETSLGCSLPPTLAFDHPNAQDLIEYLGSEILGWDALVNVNGQVPAGLTARETAEPVAVIGMACRFPGGANDPAAFWQLLHGGMDAISEVPADRWDIDAYYDPEPGKPGKTYSRYGGFLKGVDIGGLDAQFFGISPREAISMDPQHRLLLEVSWEALENAGLAPDTLVGTRTGVFVGIAASDFGQVLAGASNDPRSIDAYTGTGSLCNVASGRLSFILGLQGPNMALDTACSSSLVSVHLACQSLRTGEANLALAGGVNLMLSPLIHVYYSQLHAMASDGHCKTFDAAADGFVRSEGCGMLVLKRLSDALADGDPILALLRGSAVNHDGRSSGLTVPNGTAQQAVIRQALASAGVAPAQISYVETHGTGTALGDPIEANALAAVLNKDRQEGQSLIIGSAKTNIGHLEAAAGVAGLMKVILALQHEEIPPHLHFHGLNSQISWGKLPVTIPTAPISWPTGENPRIASVSAFGISGTNAHMVVQEAPPRSAPAAANSEAGEPAASRRPYLIPLTARSPEALLDLARAYQTFVDTTDDAVAPLQAIGSTASLKRSHHEHRLAIISHSRQELIQRLTAFVRQEPSPGVACGQKATSEPVRLAFVFSGQGSQWVGMGRTLMEQEPAFRQALEQCDQVIQQYSGWSVIEQLFADTDEARSGEIDVIQPVLFAIQVALAALWRSWGVIPQAVIGHSMGEIAAAYVGGALSLEDAAHIICLRSQLLKGVAGQGAMAAVGLSLQEARAAISAYSSDLVAAVNNGPKSTVLSGDPVALQTVLEELQQKNIFVRLVKGVDVAAHSPRTDPLCPELLQGLKEIQPHSASLLLYSTVDSTIQDGSELDAAYWARNLREPVLFWDTMQQMIRDGYNTFVEVSPHPVLLHPIEQGLDYLGKKALLLPSLRRAEEESVVMLGSLSTLYTKGYPVSWQALYPSNGRSVQLPTYPWQRKHFWIDFAALDKKSAPHSAHAAAHPLLSQHFKSVRPPVDHFWECVLDAQLHPYLSEHRIQNVAVLPCSVCLELALATAAEVFKTAVHSLEQITLHQAMILPLEGSQTLQFVLTPTGERQASFQAFSMPEDTRTPGVLLISGNVTVGMAEVLERYDIEIVRKRCYEEISPDYYYQRLREQGLDYGPSLQGLQKIYRCENEALCRVQPVEASSAHAESDYAHPALLDACFQSFTAIVLKGGDGPETDILLPVSIGQFHVYKPLASVTWSYARLLGKDLDEQVFTGEVYLLDEAGQVVAEALDLRFQPVAQEMWNQLAQRRIDDWFYEIEWQPVAHKATASPLAAAGPRGSWLIFADGQGVGAALAQKLRANGERVLLASPGAAFEQIAEDHWRVEPTDPEGMRRLCAEATRDAETPWRGIVHLWNLRAPSSEIASLAALEDASARGCSSVLYLLQMLARVKLPELPRMWLVTQGAQATPFDTTLSDPTQALLWGMGRVIALEHADLWGGLIDLDPASSQETAVTQLLAQIKAPDEEDQVAFRNEQRYVARLMRSHVAAPVQPFFLSEESTYLITGGLGGVGLHIMRWMVEHGARHLVVIGRSQFPDRSHWSDLASDSNVRAKITAIQALEERGATVQVMQADVSNGAQMATVFAQCTQTPFPLRGIIHMAGVSAPQFLRDVDLPTFRATLQPKVAGAWMLHHMTRDMHLDFLVFFSSPAAIWGSAMLGSYAAANSFLDVLAHHRHTLGLPALSINWGAWAGGGMTTTASAEVLRYLEQIGLEAMPPQQALMGLERLLQTHATQRTVAPVDWNRFKPVFEARHRRPFLEQVHALAAEVKSSMQAGEFAQQLARSAPDERWGQLTTHIQHLVATVLGFDQEQSLDLDQGFFQMGMDSVMSVQLKLRLEQSLGCSLPATLAFEYPTIGGLVGYLGREVLSLEPPGVSAGTQTEVDEAEMPLEIPESLDQYAEDELALLLEKELATIQRMKGNHVE